MTRRQRLGVFMTALLSTISVFSGCFGASEDPGPLMIRLEAVKVHAPGNLTLHLVYENAGDSPLTRIDTWWQATVRNLNGTAHGWASGKIDGAYGEWGLSNVPVGVFNESETLSSGMVKHANITVLYSVNDSPLREGEVYSVIAHADYQDESHLYRWLHVLPCVDARGTLVYKVACNTWESQRPLPVQR